MRRRAFLAALALLPLVRVASAQPTEKPPRVGYLGIARGPVYDAFLDGMRELGYLEGQNASIERRQYEGNIPRLPELAAELVRMKVDVIFATGPAPVKAVASATHEIPIVAIDLESDPIESGFVVSLARPGRNLTGVFLDLPELIGKWFEFLKATVPRLSRVALLWDPATGGAQLKAARTAARAFGVELHVLEVRGPEDFARRFKDAVNKRPQAVLQLSSPLIFLQAQHIADFAMTNRLPAISLFSVFPESGGLMSYGPDIAELYRRCGVYVGKVLKGAKVGELPIERPARFRLVVNRKAARAIGATLPPAVLLAADRMIE